MLQQIRDHVRKALGKENADLLSPVLCDSFWPLSQNTFPKNVQTTLNQAESDSPRQTFQYQGLRSFWGASVCKGIDF